MGEDKISLVAFFMVAMCVVFLFVCYGFDNILPEMVFRIPATNSDAPWNYFVSCMYVLCVLYLLKCSSHTWSWAEACIYLVVLIYLKESRLINN
jgi:hypothetical protein